MFLKNRIRKRHQTNATGRCPENIALAELEMRHFCVLPHRCTQDKLDLAFWPGFCVGGPCRWQCPSPLMETWREQTTKTRRRNPAGAEGAALLIRPKLKNLKIFAKNVHFKVQFFLCTPIGKKSCFFIGF